MAEYINRTELIKKICDCCNGNDMVGEDGCAGFVPCRRNGWLYDMPTTSIVTCQECKHWEPYPNGCYGDCTGTDAFIYGTENWWYCPCGEEKE